MGSKSHLWIGSFLFNFNRLCVPIAHFLYVTIKSFINIAVFSIVWLYSLVSNGDNNFQSFHNHRTAINMYYYLPVTKAQIQVWNEQNKENKIFFSHVRNISGQSMLTNRPDQSVQLQLNLITIKTLVSYFLNDTPYRNVLSWHRTTSRQQIYTKYKNKNHTLAYWSIFGDILLT